MKKSDIIERVNNTIKDYDMLRVGDRVVSGLSGGPDSVCLLHILWRLRDRFNLMLFPVYVNHHLRMEDEINREIEFLRDFVKGYGMELIVKDVDVRKFMESERLGMEEAGRILRYRALDEVLRDLKAQRIAVGHNANDQAETLIMRLIRGSGPWGMGGIPPVRGLIIRPLIEIKRREIEEYLYKNGLNYVIDTMNLSKEYTRNKIRLVIIPRMEEINPGVIDTLSRMAKIFREEERIYDREVSELLEKASESETEDELILSLDILEKMDLRLLRRVLRGAINKISGIEGFTFDHIESMIDLINKGKSGDRIYLPGNLRAIRSYSGLILTLRNPVMLGEYKLTIPGELHLKEINKLIKTGVTEKKPDFIGDGKTMVVVDYSKISAGPLTVRQWRHGDFFYPLGLGKRKKLQDFFVDNKIPREERYSIPLVLSGDDIIWIAGHRPDDRFKITESTERFLIMEIKNIR